MNVTVNQLRQEMTTLVQAHEMVNSFFWGDFHRAYNEQTPLYPLVCSYLTYNTMLDNMSNDNLVIIICDKTYKDYSNLNDTESDCKQVARHLFNVIRQSPRWNALLRVNSATMSKFIDNTSDEVAGVILTLNVNLKSSRSLCDLPLDNYSFDGDFEGNDCEPVLIVNSNQTFVFSAASGTIVELPDTPVLVVDQDDNELGNGSVASVTGGTIQVQIDPTPCAPVTYNVEYANGDPIESGSEPSGGNIEVIVPNPVCAPATFELNGIEVGTAASGGSLDFPVKNTANTQVGSLVSGEFIVPNATIQLTTPSGVLQTVSGASGTTTSQTLRTIGRMPYKTGSSGASTPPVSGVDGLTQRGRNFLTLDYNNAWGNPNRFTWNNGTQTYPNGVTAEGNGYAVDNATWDKDGKILLIAYVTTTRTYANQATTALGVTIDGLSGWEMISSEELSEISTGNAVASKQINFAPFNIPEGTLITTSTEYIGNNTQCLALVSGGVEGAISKAGLRNTFFVRVSTLTIDSLGNVTIS